MSGSVQAVEMSDTVASLKEDTDVVSRDREMEVEVETENCPQQENGQKLVNGAGPAAPGDPPRSLVIRFKAPRDSTESVVSPVSSIHSGSSSDSEAADRAEENEADDDEDEDNEGEQEGDAEEGANERKEEEEEEMPVTNGVVLMPNSTSKSSKKGKGKGKDVKKKKPKKQKQKQEKSENGKKENNDAKKPEAKSPKSGDTSVKRSPRKSGSPSKKSYLSMIQNALLKIKEKNGASLVKIRKFVLTNNEVKSGNSRFNQYFSATLKKAVNDKVVIRIGARYKLSDKSKAQLKAQRIKKRKPVAKKSKVKAKAKAPPKVELTAEQIRERKKKQERLRKEREVKEYKASLPKLPTASTMEAIPNQFFTDVIAIAEFCNEFAKPLKLAPFTVEMFYKAVVHESITFLIRDIHFAMLDTLLNGTEDETLQRLRWTENLNVLTWQEILRQYIVYSMGHLGESYPEFRDFEVAVTRLAERDYCSLALRTKLAILRVLSDDLLDIPAVYNVIEKNIEGRIELGKARWKLEQEHRETLRTLKKRKLDLTGGSDRSKAKKKQKTETKDDEETESEGYSSPEEEVVPMSSRKKEACLRANERNMTELGRKREESARDYQRKKMDMRVRAEPIGVDSRSNSFWVFEADRKKVYVRRGTRWQFYETRGEFDQLIASLDKYNPVDKQLKERLGLFYDRISRRLPKERESEKAKQAEKNKAQDAEKDEEVSLLQKIRPQRVSARRAQEAIRDTTKGPQPDEGDKRKQLQRQQTRSKQEEDPNAFLTYRNYESSQDGKALTTMSTADAKSLRSVEDGEDADLALAWLMEEIRAIAQSVNDSGGKFNDFRSFSASIEDIARVPEGKSTRLPKRNRLKLRKCLLEIEAAAIPVLSSKKNDKKKKKPRDEAEEEPLDPETLDELDRPILEKALKYSYGTPVHCEIQVPVTEEAKAAHTSSAKKAKANQAKDEDGEGAEKESEMDVSGEDAGETDHGRIIPETKDGRAAPGFKIELLPGSIVRFRGANYTAEDTGFDSWEVLLEDGDAAFLNEGQLVEAIQLAKATDTGSNKTKQSQKNAEYEADFAQAPLWKLRCKRDHWVMSLDSVSSVSSAALVVYEFSRQLFVLNDTGFRRKRKPVEITQ